MKTFREYISENTDEDKLKTLLDVAKGVLYNIDQGDKDTSGWVSTSVHKDDIRAFRKAIKALSSNPEDKLKTLLDVAKGVLYNIDQGDKDTSGWVNFTVHKDDIQVFRKAIKALS